MSRDGARPPAQPPGPPGGGAHASGTPSEAAPAGGKRRRASWPTVLGVLLLVSGLSILGWIGWEFWGTNVAAHREASTATRQLQQRWQQQSGAHRTTPVAPAALPVVPGDAFAIIRIPRLGSDWEYPVLDGTTPDVLARGVGWYTNTAKPGAIGNFAVAAHRVTHGEPFRHLLSVRTGDQVIVQTRDHTYTYAIDRPPAQLTVNDTDTWVIDPVPGHAGQKPTQALITLTTCAELFHTSSRSVAFGHLVSST